YMYTFAYLGYLVQEDAKKRGLGKPAVAFWSISVVFFGPIFLPLYLIFRSHAIFAPVEGGRKDKDAYLLCPHCGAENPLSEKICKKCHKHMDYEISAVGKKNCPYCGAMNPVEASRCIACDQVIGYVDDDDEN
ncbi:MAG TPA: hypothetical protein ENN67_01315, partial [Firmicutes bacterium]|nr:hypothetical protein [Bacillota bacterium]